MMLPLALWQFNRLGVVATVISVNYPVVDTAGSGQRVVVRVDNSSGCSAITAGGVAFTGFAIDDATHVSGEPGAHAAGIVDVVVTNLTGDSTTGTGLIEYWSPSQITGIDAYLDSSKGATSFIGRISQWVDQSSNARVFAQGTSGSRPVPAAGQFGLLPSIRFTPEQWLALGAVINLTSGKSYFAVAKWTTSTAAATRPGMVIIGDDATDYNCLGTDADALAFQSYDVAGVTSHIIARGSALNDGVARLVGVTSDNTSNEKIYVGTVQQGATNVATANTTIGYRSIGETYSHGAGFDGDIGAIVIVDGVISGGDHTKLDAWAQQRFGTPASTAPAFDPATLALTGWWRASYAGSPLVGVASAGASAGRDLSEGTNAPTVGAAINALDPADFDGTNDKLTSDVADVFEDFFTPNFPGPAAGSLWVLFEADTTAPSNIGTPYDNEALLSLLTGGYFLAAITDDGVIAACYDGISYKETTAIAAGTGAYHLAQIRFDGTLLECRVDSSSWQTIATIGPSANSLRMQLGVNYGGTAFFDGRIADVGTIDSKLSDADFDNVKSYINATYGLSL